MQCDSGPSFPASPLIQDDGCCAAKFHPAKPKPGSSGAPVLRGADFLARGRSARGQTLPLIQLMTLIYTDVNGAGRTGSGLHSEKLMVQKRKCISVRLAQHEKSRT